MDVPSLASSQKVYFRQVVHRRCRSEQSVNTQPEIVLISRTQDDESFLADLFYEARAHEFLPLGLPRPALEQLLSMQFRAQAMGYASQFPNADDKVIWSGGSRVGRFLVDRNGSAIQLVDIALLAVFRGHGLGTRLIGELIDEAKSKGVPLRLHVRGSNPAARLYEQLGFVATGGDGLNIAMEILPDGPGAQGVAAADAEVASSVPVAQESTGRYFRTLVGQMLTARTPDGLTVELRLDSVNSLGPSASMNGIDPGDSFALRFSGPREHVLPPAMAELTPSGARPMEIFLVPLGPRDGFMDYEAVFNRATPTS
jgi:ribosomal protein S18 acetylase RimI-like enzyme